MERSKKTKKWLDIAISLLVCLRSYIGRNAFAPYIKIMSDLDDILVLDGHEERV